MLDTPSDSLTSHSLTPRHTGPLLHQARVDAGLTVRALAEKAGTSHATLIAYEKGRKQPSLAVFERLLQACGFAPEIRLHRRIRECDGIARGDELEQVLALAEQFPARHDDTLRYPGFAQR